MKSNRHYPYRQVLLKDPCAYCGKLIPKAHQTLDHIKPRENGGGRSHGKPPKSKSNWENLTSACDECNTEKGTDSLIWFMLKRFKKHIKRIAKQKRKQQYYKQFHCFKIEDLVKNGN